MNLTPELTPDRLAGLADAAAAFNAAEAARHAAAQSAKPEPERTAYTPLTDEEYGRLRVAGMLDSYYSQSLARRAADPNNQAAFIGALKMADSDPEVAAAVAIIKAKTGVA